MYNPIEVIKLLNDDLDNYPVIQNDIFNSYSMVLSFIMKLKQQELFKLKIEKVCVDVEIKDYTVYILKCVPTGQLYVGKTSEYILKRLYKHISSSVNYSMPNAYTKMGICMGRYLNSEDWVLYSIETGLLLHDAKVFESILINHYDTHLNGLNSQSEIKSFNLRSLSQIDLFNRKINMFENNRISYEYTFNLDILFNDCYVKSLMNEKPIKQKQRKTT